VPERGGSETQHDGKHDVGARQYQPSIPREVRCLEVEGRKGGEPVRSQTEKPGLFDDEHGARRQAHEPVRSAADDPLIEL